MMQHASLSPSLPALWQGPEWLVHCGWGNEPQCANRSRLAGNSCAALNAVCRKERMDPVARNGNVAACKHAARKNQEFKNQSDY